MSVSSKLTTLAAAGAGGAPSAWVYEYGDHNSTDKSLQSFDQTSLWVNNTYGGVLGIHQDGVTTDTGKAGRPAVAHILNEDGELQMCKVLKHQNFSTNTLYQIAGCCLGNDGRFWAHLQYKHDPGTYGQMSTVAHFDSNGDISWARQVGYPTTSNSFVTNMTLEPNSNVVHTTHIDYGFSIGLGVITRYSSSGIKPWEHAYPASNNHYTYFNDVMYNSVDGKYYFCGSSTRVSPEQAIFGKFTSSSSSATQGSPAAEYNFGVEGSSVLRFHQMAHDSSGDIFVVGSLYTSPRKIVLFKFNPDMTVVAQKLISPDVTASMLYGSIHITVDSNDNVIIAGTHANNSATDRIGGSTTNNRDTVIMSFSNDLSTRNWHSVFGSELYSTHLGQGYQGATEGKRLMADNNGSFYICGGKQQIISGATKYRFFIAKLPADGSLIDTLTGSSAVGPTSHQYEWVTATGTRTVGNFTDSGTDTVVHLKTSLANYTQDSNIDSNFAPFNETETDQLTYTI